MNSTEAVREVACLVREHVVRVVDGPIHGLTFDGRRLVLAAGKRLVRLAPESGRVVDQLETFPDRGGLAYDGQHLWQLSEGRIQQIDLRTGFVQRSIFLEPIVVTGLECLGDQLLLLHTAGRTLACVETLNATPVAEIDVQTPLRGLAWATRRLWASTAGALCCIDPASGRIVAQFALPPDLEVCDIAGDAEGRLWCADGRSHVLRAFVTG